MGLLFVGTVWYDIFLPDFTCQLSDGLQHDRRDEWIVLGVDVDHGDLNVLPIGFAAPGSVHFLQSLESQPLPGVNVVQLEQGGGRQHGPLVDA